VDVGEGEDFGAGSGVVGGGGEKEVGRSEWVVTVVGEEGSFEGGC